jgi:hypothetical protein
VQAVPQALQLPVHLLHQHRWPSAMQQLLLQRQQPQQPWQRLAAQQLHQ